MDVLAATDFFTAEVWTQGGLVTYYVFFSSTWLRAGFTLPASRRIPTSSG